MKDLIVEIYKHLPGRHNQKLHANKFRGPAITNLDDIPDDVILSSVGSDSDLATQARTTLAVLDSKLQQAHTKLIGPLPAASASVVEGKRQLRRRLVAYGIKHGYVDLDKLPAIKDAAYQPDDRAVQVLSDLYIGGKSWYDATGTNLTTGGLASLDRNKIIKWINAWGESNWHQLFADAVKYGVIG